MRAGITVSVSELAVWVSTRVPSHRRYLLGIAGPPAAGKSTLAQNLAAAITAEQGIGAQIAPMDGFHRTSAELDAIDARHRKGQPDTFDVDGFLAQLTLLRDAPLGGRVSWPIFDRELDDPVPEAITFIDQRMAVVEGNYLLLDQPGWAHVGGWLDEVWYLDADDRVIEPRLIKRHLPGGKTLEQVHIKIAESDMPNARLIAATRDRAEVVLRESDGDYRIEEVR